MMALEQNLSKTDLNTFKEAPLQIMAKSILKYRNFQTKYALEKINKTIYSNTSALQYFNSGIHYLENGATHKRVPKKLYQYIDEYKQRISPLTPSNDQKRRRNNKCKTITERPIILKSVPTPQLTIAFKYAVQIGNKFYTFNTKEEQLAFRQALAEYSNNECKLCHITTEVEED